MIPNCKKIIDTIYPVGSIYMSINDVSPDKFLGGKWEQIKDRFLLGAGDTYEAGTEGGEAEHKLTVDELPKFNVSLPMSNESGAQGWPSHGNWNNESYTNIQTGGKDKPHNNMPPYLTVYMWKRTA